MLKIKEFIHLNKQSENELNVKNKKIHSLQQQI
jgi:hypothetical protein